QFDHRAIDLDPLRAPLYFALGLHTFNARRWQESEKGFRKTLELNPQYAGAHKFIACIYVMQSKLAEAMTEAQKESTPGYDKQALTLVYYGAGKKKESDAVLADYILGYQNQAAFQIAELFAYRGELDKALEWLERAYSQRDGGLVLMKG